MDKVTLTIELTTDERERIEQLAHQRGFSIPGDYLLALAEIDAKAQVDDQELTKDELIENFRQGWREAMRGEVYPIETLWDGIDDE